MQYWQLNMLTLHVEIYSEVWCSLKRDTTAHNALNYYGTQSSPRHQSNKAQEAVNWRKISVTHPQTMANLLYCCGRSLRHEHARLAATA